MTHVRQSLRTALVAALTGLGATGSRVYAARTRALDLTAGATLEVEATGEDATIESIHPAALVERVVQVVVTGRARDNATPADTLDTIAEQVETALGSSITVGGKPVPLAYQGCDIEFSGDGDQVIGRIGLRYAATLYTAANAPGTLSNG